MHDIAHAITPAPESTATPASGVRVRAKPDPEPAPVSVRDIRAERRALWTCTWKKCAAMGRQVTATRAGRCTECRRKLQRVQLRPPDLATCVSTLCDNHHQPFRPSRKHQGKCPLCQSALVSADPVVAA